MQIQGYLALKVGEAALNTALLTDTLTGTEDTTIKALGCCKAKSFCIGENKI